MSVRFRGPAAWMAAVAVLLLATFAQAQPVQDKDAPATDREKVSYMIGADVGRSIAAVGPDLDLAAFERAVKNAFAGGKPLLSDEESKTVGMALMQRIAERTGKPMPGAAPGTKPPSVAKDKVGFMVGTDVGRSLTPIKDEIDLPMFLKAMRTLVGSGKSLMTETEMDQVRESFSKRMQAREEARIADLGRKNGEEGAAFLAKNKSAKGVITTSSGLQYMVLRQGTGPRPLPSDRVRVNYHGTLLDGTVFDSSYERGQPIDFALNQVIAGWTEGVALMPVGAKYRLWIPASIAYGERGSPPTIGPNATLMFDVELLDVL
jgi:FKBP-type peptidyl-prolyl cis-trans isomerase FkpA